MAAISLFWYTNMAAVTSDENDLLKDFKQLQPTIESEIAEERKSHSCNFQNFLTLIPSG
jgi:hypothetical protein